MKAERMQVCVVLFSFLKNVRSHFYEASLKINFELIYFIALQDIWELEQTLEQSQKENREMEKDLERERRNKDDLEKQIKLLNMEKGQLIAEVDTLRDELENARKGDDVGSSSGIMDEAEEKKCREMEETVRMKNKQIQSLLEEIEQACIYRNEFSKKSNI